MINLYKDAIEGEVAIDSELKSDSSVYYRAVRYFKTSDAEIFFNESDGLGVEESVFWRCGNHVVSNINLKLYK